MLYFPYKMRLQSGTSKVSEAQVRDHDFIFELSSDYPRIVSILAEATQGFSAEILNLKFRRRCSIWWTWRITPVAPHIVLDVSFEKRIHRRSHFSCQAQRLVSLADESCCSAHCTGRSICDADQS